MPNFFLFVVTKSLKIFGNNYLKPTASAQSKVANQ